MRRKYPTWKLITALVCGGTLRIAACPDAAGLMSMALLIWFTAVVLSLLYIQWSTGFSWRHLLRDVAVVTASNLLVAAAVTAFFVISRGTYTPPNSAFIAPGILSSTLGFFLAGVLSESHRLSHLAYVLIGVWLVNGLQILFTPFSMTQWLVSLFFSATTMWAGYGLSRLVRPEKQEQIVTDNP